MSQEKFRDFVLHVCSIWDDPSKLSETKLQKALWFADTYAYRKLGHSLSGGTYIKETNGPVPEGLQGALSELERTGMLTIHPENIGQPGMHWLDVMQAEAGRQWSHEERGIVQVIVDVISRTHTDKSISDLSHDQVWKSFDMGEEIPISAVIAARSGEVTEEDIQWGREIMGSPSKAMREFVGEREHVPTA